MPQRLPPAFTAPGFARLWLTTLFIWWGWFLVSLTQGWLMLQITDSPAWVGLSVGVRGFSLTVFSVAGGAIADRVDRRRLLVAATGFGLILMLTAAALVAGGGLRPWHLLALMGLMGVLAAVERPTSAGLMYDLVGPERLLNATAVRLMGFSIVQALSGLVGGFVLARLSPAYNLALAATGYAGAVLRAAGLQRPPQAMRGRVLGFCSSTTGFSHLGGLLIGLVAVPLGAPAAITVSGALTMAGAVVLGVGLRTLEPRQEEPAGPKKA